MATAVEGYAYSRSPSASVARSPDTASPIYPERAIRPLPKSRLKSRLSPEQQGTIIYPPDPPPVSPALNFGVQENVTGHAALTNGDSSHHHHHHHETILVHDHCTCRHEEGDSGDEEVEFDHPDYRYATATASPTLNGKPLDSVQRRLMEASRVGRAPAGPGSVASSADGYESFENTSNKKKRKIPLSSASSMHQSSLSAEMASMGISHTDGAIDEGGMAAQQHYPGTPASPTSGTGISGAGRGRYGRQGGRDSRRPLGSSTMNSINGYGTKFPPHSGSGDVNGYGEQTHDSNRLERHSVARGLSADDGRLSTRTDPLTGQEHLNGGIISQAIKTAAEQGPMTPQKGKENISLLQQSASTSVTPKTQFTFTCESDSATKMLDEMPMMSYQVNGHGAGTPTPQRHPNGVPMPPGKGMSNVATQTTPSLRNNPHAAMAAPRNMAAPNASHLPQAPASLASNNHQQGANAPAAAPKPKPRRRPSKEYALAARQRKLQQEYTNYHHRPTGDNLWICEFCEYEDIFGVAPVAMIRAYEIKDRQERKKAAEKRRLLEKAKMKNRKGKKGANNGSKGGKNNAGAPSNPANPAGGPGYDPTLPPPEGDEYFEDEEYGDEYEPVGPDDQYAGDYYPPPLPAPAVTAHVPTPGGGGAKAIG